MTEELLYEDGPKPGEFVGPRQPYLVEFLRRAGAFVDATDPLRGPNLLKHSGLVDMGNGTLKINRPVRLR